MKKLLIALLFISPVLAKSQCYTFLNSIGDATALATFTERVTHTTISAEPHQKGGNYYFSDKEKTAMIKVVVDDKDVIKYIVITGNADAIQQLFDERFKEMKVKGCFISSGAAYVKTQSVDIVITDEPYNPRSKKPKTKTITLTPHK